MKLFTTSIICICFLSSEAILLSQGQGDRGLLLGFNASSFKGSESLKEKSTYLPGMRIGFFQEFNLLPGLVIGPEISFTSKGSRIQTVGDLYLHQVITYMEVPVLLSWIMNPGQKCRGFLSGGPSFGLMLLAFNEVGFPDDIARFDLGTELGAGVRWQKLRLSLHINQGFLDLDRSDASGSLRNRTFSFKLALAF
jgi:hypothetical protein